jgi:hypothetical protein
MMNDIKGEKRNEYETRKYCRWVRGRFDSGEGKARGQYGGGVSGGKGG